VTVKAKSRKARKQPKRTFQRWLRMNGACAEARRWVGHKTAMQAVKTCWHEPWLRWLYIRLTNHVPPLDEYGCTVRYYLLGRLNGRNLTR